jgi:AbrB family looped-hinge helix DNA binding protein
MSTTVTSKGQVTIPRRVRDLLGIGPGSKVDFERAPGWADRSGQAEQEGSESFCQTAWACRQGNEYRRDHGIDARRSLTLVDTNILLD